MTDAGSEELDAAAGTWLTGLAGLDAQVTASPDAGEENRPPALTQVRLDGKAVRGARNPDGSQVRLLAALVGPDAASSVVAAQAAVGAKTNEVPVAAVVLSRLDLRDKVVTADALHTVKATARLIREGGGQFVLPVKENRRSLFDAIEALPWKDVPVAHSATDRGHGRITTRRAITGIAATIVAMALAFSVVNVTRLCLDLGVIVWIAWLVGPAVDLSVIGLLTGIRFLSLHGCADAGVRQAEPFPAVLRPAVAWPGPGRDRAGALVAAVRAEAAARTGPSPVAAAAGLDRSPMPVAA